MVPERRSALLVALVGALVLAAGLGPAAATQPPAVEQFTTQSSPDEDANATDDPVDGEAVVERMRSRLGNAETLVMAYETTATVDGNRTTTTEQTVWVDYEHDRLRMETKRDGTEQVTVRNESATVTYHVDDERLSRFDGGDGPVARTQVDRMLNRTEFSYEGREQIDGTRTYRLQMTPTDDTTAESADGTLWIDAETYTPVRLHIATETADFEYEMTAQFRNVTLNASIPDERFTLDVPEDVETSSNTPPNRTTYESVSALRNGTDRTVPDPTVPDRFAFEEGRVVEGDDYHAVTLRYADDDDRLHVTTRPAIDYDFADSDTYESVAVGNETGYYAEYEHDDDTTAVLVLPCEDDTHSVFGDLTRSAAVDVAASLACE